MKRRSSRMVALALFCLLTLFACAPSPTQTTPDTTLAIPTPTATAEPTPDTKKTLTVWHLWSTDSDANAKSFAKVLADWQALNPDVKVIIEATENEAYKTKIKTAINANEAPDVFFAWGGGFAKPFAEAGALLPLDEYLADGTKERLVAGALDNYTYDNKVYGLPFIQWVGALYCNETLFQKYGVKMPTTQEELLQAVATFRSHNIVPLAVGAKDGWPAMLYQNAYAIRTAGAARCNAALAGSATFDSPEFVASAKLLDDLIKAGAFAPDALSKSYDEAKMPFLNGETPMIFQGSWLAGEIQDETLSHVKGQVKALNWPALSDNQDTAHQMLGGSVDGFMVSNTTTDKELAADFVKYFAENMSRESFRLGAGVAMWKIDMTGITVDPLVAQIIDIADNANGSVLAWDTFLTGETADKHKSLVQEIFAGSITPENFASDMATLQKP